MALPALAKEGEVEVGGNRPRRRSHVYRNGGSPRTDPEGGRM